MQIFKKFERPSLERVADSPVQYQQGLQKENVVKKTIPMVYSVIEKVSNLIKKDDLASHYKQEGGQ